MFSCHELLPLVYPTAIIHQSRPTGFNYSLFGLKRTLRTAISSLPFHCRTFQQQANVLRTRFVGNFYTFLGLFLVMFLSLYKTSCFCWWKFALKKRKKKSSEYWNWWGSDDKKRGLTRIKVFLLLETEVSFFIFSIPFYNYIKYHWFLIA